MNMKAATAVVISIMAGAPMMLWLVLGASGVLGEFGNSGLHEVIKWVLFGLTLVFYFIFIPFILWPRILNGSEH